jgi:hypothetical protein
MLSTDLADLKAHMAENPGAVIEDVARDRKVTARYATGSHTGEMTPHFASGAGAELFSDGHAPSIPGKHRQIGVSGEDLRRAAFRLRVRKVDALRKLYDPVSRESGDDPLPELLVDLPDVAEVATSVKEDDPVAKPPLQLPGIEGVEVTHIGEVDAASIQVRPFSEPYGCIAHVVVVRKSEKRAAPVPCNERGQHLIEPVAEPAQDRHAAP